MVLYELVELAPHIQDLPATTTIEPMQGQRLTLLDMDRSHLVHFDSGRMLEEC
jgi:hypothetical protein